jgi:hypothetical protein
MKLRGSNATLMAPASVYMVCDCSGGDAEALSEEVLIDVSEIKCCR